MSTANELAQHIDRLQRLPAHDDDALRALLERQNPIYVARAPGRLDVMGGIGDYSGSLVLELPIAEAAFAAVQQSHSGDVVVASLGSNSDEPSVLKTISTREWSELREGDFANARRFFERDSGSSWAAYVVGTVLILLRKTHSRFSGGLRILIDSQVPEGKGVSSSAAIEVATMRAVASLLRIDLPGEELAKLCQLAENDIVGAPCGIMDQMTSALGRENELLALRCQPANVEGFVAIPQGISLWGIDSGIRHAVSGSDYGSVRCGAFMGYRIIGDTAGLKAKPTSYSPCVIEIIDPFWNGYLANITPREFRRRFADVMPEAMIGREFLDRYGGITDRATCVDASRIYAVRAATLHPIEENERAGRFRSLLEGTIDDESLREMGQLMAAAHQSYTACGLASDGTDLLVELVREAGPTGGLYGAKITGGGSGGTVAILGRSGADETVAGIARRYSELTGRTTNLFQGSSPGACDEAVQVVELP
ncbi:MAG TPA: hypothetical protein VFW73_07900 [Lacipirellulaceae bacterium]|nr:hypothetical protein [Lacipirellulaceae bacterium]